MGKHEAIRVRVLFTSRSNKTIGQTDAGSPFEYHQSAVLEVHAEGVQAKARCKISGFMDIVVFGRWN